MERDFMGLNSRDSELVVKEVLFGGDSKDSGYKWSSGVLWTSSNKVSGFPQFMSLKNGQDKIQSIMKSDCVVPPGFVVKSGLDILEAGHQRQPVNIQNFGMATMKQQFCVDNSPTSHRPLLPSPVPVVATGEQWLKSKASNVPAQLTIFYAGTVNVFDDISPEKAQAILLLAGNGCILNQAHMPTSKSPSANMALVNQPMNMSPGSGLPSPLSVSSHALDQSGGAAAKDNEDKVGTMIDMSNTLVNKVEPPRIVSLIGSSVVTAMISSAIPQSRKASLARFLQKRNERVLSAAPYNIVKKEANGSTTPWANGFEFSDTSGVDSSFTPTSKRIIGDL